MRSIVFLACLTSTAAAAPTDVTFRWAATAPACRTAWEVRATGTTCMQVSNTTTFVVAAYAPTASDPRVPVIRYNGDHAGAPQAWIQYLDLGSAGEPLVAVVDDTVIVVGIGKDGVKLVALAARDGVRAATATVPITSAARLQIEGTKAALHLHVLDRDGSGHALALDPKTLATSVRSDVPARAIRTVMSKAAISADGSAAAGDFAAVWDEADLVVRKRGGWEQTIVRDDRFRMQHVTLHATRDRVVVTVHHAIASGAQVFAYDPASGAKSWERHLTGIGPIAHSKYFNRVASFVDGDMLVAQSVEAGGAYVCTVALADGRELACVDHLPDAAIVKPADAKVDTSPLPPEQSIGPVTTKLTCVPASAPAESLAFAPGAGTTKGKRPKPITWIDGTVVAASRTCQPSLGGGVVGDRVELTVFDDKQAAAAPCACTFEFRTPTNKDTRTVILRARGKELARQPLTVP